MCMATPPPARPRIYGVGLTGIPVFNVNNNCSTGSSALFLARQAVESGMVECVLALGFRADAARRAEERSGTTGLRPCTALPTHDRAPGL
jgi:acetyl-CoA acetyltransferase